MKILLIAFLLLLGNHCYCYEAYLTDVKTVLLYDYRTGKYNIYLVDLSDIDADYIYENFEILPYESVRNLIYPDMPEYIYGF